MSEPVKESLVVESAVACCVVGVKNDPFTSVNPKDWRLRCEKAKLPPTTALSFGSGTKSDV